MTTIGLFSFLGGILGGGAQKKASRRAEQQLFDFLGQALGQQTEQRQQIRTDTAPYREFGAEALDRRGDLLGFNGEPAQQTGFDAIRNSPWYQMLYRNGMESTQQNLNATGGLRGGNAQRSFADFGADTFATSLERMLGQLGEGSQLGLSATGMNTGATTAVTQQIAELLKNQGETRAGGTLTRGGINAGMWRNAGSFLDDSIKQIFSAITGGAGGF